MSEIPIIKVEDYEILDVELEEDVLEKNRRIAEENRRKLDEHRILCIDVMGAIGSGKTSFIERSAEKLKNKYRIAVIAGDVTTTIDAERVSKHSVFSIQVNTGRECHLDANMISKALKELDLENLDLIFIENVGNLICPAEFDLGAHKRVVIVSVTEGEYVIIKHPMIFAEADLIIINKIDLADAMGVNVEKLVEDAKKVNPRAVVVKASMKTGVGLNEALKALRLEG